MPPVLPDDLSTWIGKETGVSEWVTVDQTRINAFAHVTEDWQAIHVDAEAAAESMFGGTIAHGFLTLSLLSKFAHEAAINIVGAVAGINYGFNRLRLPAPVRSGKRLRGRLVLKTAEARSGTRFLLSYDVVVEIEGEDKPALVAEWLTMQEIDRSGQLRREAKADPGSNVPAVQSSGSSGWAVIESGARGIL